MVVCYGRSCRCVGGEETVNPGRRCQAREADKEQTWALMFSWEVGLGAPQKMDSYSLHLGTVVCWAGEQWSW